MKKNILNIISAFFYLANVAFMMNLSYQLAIYSDELGKSPATLLNGEMWNYLSWILLASSILLLLFNLLNIFKNNKNKNKSKLLSVGTIIFSIISIMLILYLFNFLITHQH